MTVFLFNRITAPGRFHLVDLDLDATVLRAAFFGLVVGDRLALTKTLA